MEKFHEEVNYSKGLGKANKVCHFCEQEYDRKLIEQHLISDHDIKIENTCDFGSEKGTVFPTIFCQNNFDK